MMVCSSWARGGEAPSVPGEILVRFQSGTSHAAVDSINAANNGVIVGTFAGDRYLYLVRQTKNNQEAANSYNQEPRVAFAEPNYLFDFSARPNDPLYSQQFAYQRISAEPAWDVTIGDPTVVLADTDTGVDFNHPDMTNIWLNLGEICDNGIDDDMNGYVDDCFGWDFSTGTPSGWDTNGHGSDTAGIMAATGNNGIGVTGVMWTASIMVLKIGNGSFPISLAIQAIDYAWANGARIINASWGGSVYVQALKDAIDRAANAGVLFVTSAGNGGTNNDVFPVYPANYTSPNIISVASTSSLDRLWTGSPEPSNYGPTTVHLGAPGANILNLTTVARGSYGRWYGTSMASPHVAGVAGLIWSYNPGLSYADVKAIILGSVDPLDTLQTTTITGGRLNAAAALQLTPPP
jgi:subtilisin family serine protease